MRVVLSRGLHNISTQCHTLQSRWQSTSVLARSGSEHSRQEQQKAGPTPKLPKFEPGKLFAPNSPEATRARSLFRAILRQCTYLPDQSARQYMPKYALSRFCKTGYKAHKRKDKPEDLALLLEAQEYKAARAARKLSRANEGERKCLLKVLLTTYGRIGKRRRQLMLPLLPAAGSKQDDRTESQSDFQSETARDEGDTTATSKVQLTLQLRTLLRSQMRVKPPNLTRPNPRRLEPDIPELNSWLKPMPVKRVKKAREKHYALLLDRVLPPLPTEEWYGLRNLASGKAEPVEPSARRIPAASGDVGVESRGSALEMVVQYGKVPKRVFKNKEAHKITSRFMRRLYKQVFSQCPLMEWDTAREEWKVTWGEQALNIICDGRTASKREEDKKDDSTVESENDVLESAAVNG